MKTESRWICNHPDNNSVCMGNEEAHLLDSDGNKAPLRLMPMGGHSFKCPFDKNCTKCTYGEKVTDTVWPTLFVDGKERYEFHGDYEELVETVPSDFRVGGFDDGSAPSKTICKICGGDKFEVGNGDYETVLRCPTCKWEFSYHIG